MIKYTLFTEKHNNIQDLLDGVVTGYSIMDTVVACQNVKWHGVAIIILSEANIDKKVTDLAKAIKFANEQREIQVQREIVDVQFL